MWVFATRGRVENCRRFIESWNKTEANTEVYLRLDDCDPCLSDLLNLQWPDSFQIIVGSREGLRAAVNEGFEKFPNKQWYGWLADDLIPRTKKWDQLLVQKAGQRSISYPNDLGGKPKLPTHPIVGGDLVRAVGWFGLPTSAHLYLDTAWKTIGENLNCIHRMPDVVVEHVHPFWKKAKSDIIYKENKVRAAKDKENYFKWVKEEAPSLISRLKKQGFGNV